MIIFELTEGVSLNEWYSSKHWTSRQRIKKKFCKLFQENFKGNVIKQFVRYQVELTYNTRLDPSNTITLVKLAEDYLVSKGYLKDDSKQYCRGIYIAPDETLKKGLYVLKIFEV